MKPQTFPSFPLQRLTLSAKWPEKERIQTGCEAVGLISSAAPADILFLLQKQRLSKPFSVFILAGSVEATLKHGDPYQDIN